MIAAGRNGRRPRATAVLVSATAPSAPSASVEASRYHTRATPESATAPHQSRVVGESGGVRTSPMPSQTAAATAASTARVPSATATVVSAPTAAQPIPTMAGPARWPLGRRHRSSAAVHQQRRTPDRRGGDQPAVDDRTHSRSDAGHHDGAGVASCRRRDRAPADDGPPGQNHGFGPGQRRGPQRRREEQDQSERRRSKDGGLGAQQLDRPAGQPRGAETERRQPGDS